MFRTRNPVETVSKSPLLLTDQLKISAPSFGSLPLDQTCVAHATNPIWGDDMPLNLQDAAAYTGMPLPTFKQKIYSREIASVKVGRRRKVRPSAIRTYLSRYESPSL